MIISQQLGARQRIFIDSSGSRRQRRRSRGSDRGNCPPWILRIFSRIHRVFAAYFLCTLRVLRVLSVYSSRTPCTLRVFAAYSPRTFHILRVLSMYSLRILRVFSMYSMINFAVSLNCVCVYLYVSLSVHVRCVCRARTYIHAHSTLLPIPPDCKQTPPFVVAVAFRGTAFARLGIARFAFRKSALRGIRARFTKIYRAPFRPRRMRLDLDLF